MSLVTISITATTSSIYAAVIATVSLVFSVIAVRRDRARIKIKYGKNYSVIKGQLFGYDSNKTYFNVTVINIGRRPVRIEKAALKLMDKGFWLFTGSFVGHRNKILTEDNPVSEFLVEQETLDFSRVLCISVFDATGREYRKYLSVFPTVHRLIFLLKKYFIKKK